MRSRRRDFFRRFYRYDQIIRNNLRVGCGKSIRMIPDFLKEPSYGGHIYGKLIYVEKDHVFRISGEPLLLEYAKRIFPGAKVTRGGGGHLEFNCTRREISDLNWLLLRFPVNVDQCKGMLDGERQRAIDQINRRVSGSDRTRTTPPSDFLGKLYPYQESAVTFMTVNQRCLLSDGMGLGKTWSGLAAAATAGEYPVLIVCQAHVQKQWQRMVGMLFDLPGLKGQRDMKPFELATKRGEALAPILTSRTATKIPGTPFAIIHYGLLAWWQKEILRQGFKTVLFDEVQELRHTGTGKYSAASLFSSNANNVYGLSGTPVFGYGKEIWSVMNAIDFHCLGSEEAFTREWCAGYGEKIVSDPKALNGHLSREGLMLRRRFSDPEVGIDVPMVVRNIEDLAHDESLYDSLISATRSKVREYDSAGFHMKGRLARDIERESRKATGVAKARYVAEFVASLLEAGERPLVYAWHHDVHDILQERLRMYNPAIFTGKQSTKKKDDSLKKFMDGGTDLGLLSLRSAAGLDGLQYRATMCVFAELDWSPACHGQAETRIARIGVDDSVNEIPSYYCVASVGHDEVMLDVLGVKTGQFVGLMGDEPESYEEQKDSEERAARRIDVLVDKLDKEEKQLIEKNTRSDKVDDDVVDGSSCNRLIGAFGGRLRDGESKEKDKE